MLTQEQKMAICEDYKDNKNTVEEIATKYGIQVPRLHVVPLKWEQSRDVPKCTGRGLSARMQKLEYALNVARPLM